MSGLKLGDLILDPRRVLYIPSLRAVVCSGLQEALGVGIAGGVRGVLERIDSVLADYKPEALIVLGKLDGDTGLTGMARRWGKKVRLQLVANDPDSEAKALAEALGCEVHHELVWGRYRFVEGEQDKGALELQFLTIMGSPHYSVRVGRGPFGGMKLAVFLKGLGRVVLPTLDPSGNGAASVFTTGLERFDVFAAGHQRVLPMGKVADLKPIKGIARGLPIAKATLGGRRRAPKEPSAD